VICFKKRSYGSAEEELKKLIQNSRQQTRNHDNPNNDYNILHFADRAYRYNFW